MEDFFQDKAGDPLQQGGEQHRAEKQQKGVAAQRVQKEEYDHDAHAVDGAHRAVKKAAVYKAA